MKYVVILMDGASDYPVDRLGGKTPLQYAKKPFIDFLAKRGKLGMVKTIPDDFPPGSDIANLSVLSYDPGKYYSGRSSLEAVSMGINLSQDDVTFRCNLVTLSNDENFWDKVLIDYSAGEISTKEAKVLIEYVEKNLKISNVRFYPGVSYRHVIVWRGGPNGLSLTPPHDIQDQKISSHLPKGPLEDMIIDMMAKSYRLLIGHPINKKRIKKGLKPANSIWIWGEGRKPKLDSFCDKYNMDGSVIAGVDLIKGIGICAGLKPVNVRNVTGDIHTNFEGQAKAAVAELLKGKDFVYVHIEAPDECSHHGDLNGKIKAIEFIDRRVVRLIKKGLDKKIKDYKILILPDHATPISLKTHISDPVPFLIYDSGREIFNSKNSFDEICAKEQGVFISEGYKLMDYFIGNCRKS